VRLEKIIHLGKCVALQYACYGNAATIPMCVTSARVFLAAKYEPDAGRSPSDVGTQDNSSLELLK
jgi:hypothetical protein